MTSYLSILSFNMPAAFLEELLLASTIKAFV